MSMNKFARSSACKNPNKPLLFIRKCPAITKTKYIIKFVSITIDGFLILTKWLEIN